MDVILATALNAMQLAGHTAGHHVSHHTQHQSPLMRWVLHLGPVGIFVVAFLDGWVIPLPIPGSTDLLLLMFLVRHGNPWIFAPLAIVGSTIGGTLTWQFGKTGGERVLTTFVPKRLLDRVCQWVESRAFFSVLIATVLPPPVPLTPFALVAGALHVGRRTFILAYVIGRSIRYSLIAWLAVRYGRQILRAWRHYSSGYEGRIAWTLAAITLVGLGYSFYKYRKMIRRASAEEFAKAA
jgi:membrane protein YqaA with SNARE-associated domain